MNKAFVKESAEADEEEDAPESALPDGTKNYMTVRGHARIRAEIRTSGQVERPAMVHVVVMGGGQWRSFGKRRLHLRQEAATAKNRTAYSLSGQAPRIGRDCRSGADQRNATRFFAADRSPSAMPMERKPPTRSSASTRQCAEGRISWIFAAGARTAQGTRRRHGGVSTAPVGCASSTSSRFLRGGLKTVSGPVRPSQ